MKWRTWSPGERVARFVEFVELVDLLLRQEVTTYDGTYYQCQEAETIPLPVQRPCPPQAHVIRRLPRPRQRRLARCALPFAANIQKWPLRRAGQIQSPIECGARRPA